MNLVESRCEDAPRAIAWEECACLLCGGARMTPILEAADRFGDHLRFLVVRCERCGLCFTNPRPDPTSIQAFYPADYGCHANKPRLTKADLPIEKPATGPARLLDFGCGGGDFLKRMQTLGWEATGLDMAEPAVERARSVGLAAFVGTLPHPLWHEPCFEAITMRQSLEHTHQPLEVMREAHRLLTDRGKLLVTVPNFDGFGARWFGANWYGLDLPRHLIQFTPTTLTLMLRQAGFAAIECRQDQHTSWIRHSGRNAGNQIFASRLGSSLAGAWSRFWGRAEGLLAIARK